jgi:hypothetical protein
MVGRICLFRNYFNESGTVATGVTRQAVNETTGLCLAPPHKERQRALDAVELATSNICGNGQGARAHVCARRSRQGHAYGVLVCARNDKQPAHAVPKLYSKLLQTVYKPFDTARIAAGAIVPRCPDMYVPGPYAYSLLSLGRSLHATGVQMVC